MRLVRHDDGTAIAYGLAGDSVGRPVLVRHGPAGCASLVLRPIGTREV